MAPLDSHFFHIHPPPKSHQPPSPYLINNERSLNWLIEKMCIILFTELKSIPSLNKKANRGYHKTSSEDDKAPRGMGNFHIKRKSCSYVLVVKKVVLVFVMLFSRTKSTAGTFASELTIWNEVVWYVRIDISEGRKKNSSKVHKTASGYLLEIVFILPMSLPPPRLSLLYGSPPVSANLKCFSFKAPESKKYIYRLSSIIFVTVR